jgi:small subunit ribosomal protein S4
MLCREENLSSGTARSGPSETTDYRIQLRKAKVRQIYSAQEASSYIHLAEQKKGDRENAPLLSHGWTSMVFRIGFASSGRSQQDDHGHIKVNGRKVDIVSLPTKPGMAIEVHEKSRSIQGIDDSLKTVTRRGIPSWLDVDVEAFKGVVKALPTREELPPTIKEQLIVEFYSK